ncbi:hypothetical protein NEOLEDRAFT_1151429 [Neolentinus lepideus HHB14362 ss-1]|uniref:Uncharacterized protein n=1 Tax=Neolentinus lepideus HHB14362 ss-1 TaxID=1314782 RepID=A0A165NZR6_9AGAM|nr:hypothetical protein NEOLEDRAFT_1151429 [Neolentinus lepideus HHB14362 ss-1]
MYEKWESLTRWHQTRDSGIINIADWLSKAALDVMGEAALGYNLLQSTDIHPDRLVDYETAANSITWMLCTLTWNLKLQTKVCTEILNKSTSASLEDVSVKNAFDLTSYITVIFTKFSTDDSTITHDTPIKPIQH